MYSTSEMIVAAIVSTMDGLKWVAVIVAGYMILDWINEDDNDPDGYA